MDNLLVIGCGLMGGSVAHAAAQAGYAVHVWDTDALVQAKAVQYFPLWNPATGDDLTGLALVATPPLETAEVVGRLLCAHPQLVVSDIASTKMDITTTLTKRLGRDELRRFIPGHPLAGREGSGFDQADPHMFLGAPWIICDEHEIDIQVMDQVSRFIEALGARQIRMSAQEHDEHVAVISHLVQVVASALMGVVGNDPKRLAASGSGLRDTTRVANLQAELWVDILLANRVAVLGALDDMQAQLYEVAALVEQHDRGALGAWLGKNSDIRKQLELVRWDADARHE